MWKNKKLFVVLILFFAVGIILISQPAWAGVITDKVDQFGKQVYGDTTNTDPLAIAATVIRTFLGLLGIIAVALIMYAGFLYMTSQGETEKIKKAKNTMIYAAIGLLIILTAYTIATFIFNAILSGTGGGGGPSTGDGVGGPVPEGVEGTP